MKAKGGVNFEEDIQDSSNQKELPGDQELKDVSQPEMTIYSDKYYSDLLNSLNFSEKEEDFHDHFDRRLSTIEDIRSPFLYMKGGVRTMRLMKTLRGKSESLTQDLNQKRKEEIEKELKRAAYLCEKEAKDRIKARHVGIVQVALENARTQARLSLRER